MLSLRKAHAPTVDPGDYASTDLRDRLDSPEEILGPIRGILDELRRSPVLEKNQEQVRPCSDCEDLSHELGLRRSTESFDLLTELVLG